MAQTVLSDEVKTFVVQQLACFDTPSEVAKVVKEEFGVEIARQSIEAYNPSKRAGASLSDEYRQLFEATRRTFLECTAEIGISHRAVRLRTLQRLADKAERTGNMVLVASLLEQAAKEAGNAFTNKRELGGIGGAAIQAEVAVKPDVGALNQAGRDALRTVLEQVAGRSCGDPEGD